MAQLDLVIAMFGGPVRVLGGRGDGCVVQLGDGRTGVLDVAGRFVQGDAPPESNATSWGDRWEAAASAGEVVVVDAHAKRRMRVELDARGYAAVEHCCVHAGRLWVAGDGCVTSVRVDALEAVFVAKDRTVTVAARSVYPLREREAAQPARVAWVLASGEAHVNIGTRRIHVNGAGLERSTDIVLRDELYPGVYAVVERPDGTRVALVDVDAIVTREVRVVRSKVMAAREVRPVEAITSTDPRLEQLVAELARDPDSDANRTVLVDLLQELGVAFGKWVAEGGAEKARKRKRDALGPLAPYLDDVYYRRGWLPWFAKLVRRPPLDDDQLAAAVSDLRLGMLSELRVGSGPVEVYAQLVGAPRAIGLRGVDLHDRRIADALIARAHTALTHVYDVRFTKDDLLERLTDVTFDGLVEIETVVQRQHLQGLVARVRADRHGVFRRPRRLTISERHGHAMELLVALEQFTELPCRELRIGALTVRKEPDGVHARLTDAPGAPWYVERIAAALPGLAGLEVADEASRRTARAQFPHLVA